MPSPRPEGSGGPSAEPARIEALLDLRRWDEAARLAGELVAQRPGDAGALLLLARALHGADRNTEAVAAARSARANAPAWDEPLRIEAWALAKADPRGAVEAARGARDRNPHRSANWVALSFLAAQVGWLDEADQAAAQARALAPGSAEAMNVTGVVSLKRKRWSDAEQWFRAALALDPQSPHLLNNLALALRNQGLGDEAMELFERSLAADPHDPLPRHNLGATVREEMWRGGAQWVLIAAVAVVWLGSTTGHAVLTVMGAVAAIGAIGFVLFRRRNFTEGRKSALREYERKVGRGSTSIFKDPARRRRVVVLVGLILALTVMLMVGTRVQGERPTVQPASGP